MRPTKLSQAEIERRVPVWHALSDLFLDTDSSLFYPSIGLVLTESGYDEEQLWHILWTEVAPVFAWNAYSMTGVWEGWPQDYVAEQVIKRLNRPLRSLNALGVHLPWHRYCKAHFQAVRPALARRA